MGSNDINVYGLGVVGEDGSSMTTKQVVSDPVSGAAPSKLCMLISAVGGVV